MPALLALTALVFAEVQASSPPTACSSQRPQRGSGARVAEAASPLAFGEIFAPGPDLVLSEKVRSLRGCRVRMEGYAARMEDAPAGAFWLVPLPVKGDESGAGVGDLPPDSVLVIVRSAGDLPIRPAAPGVISVAGVLEVGRDEAAGPSSLLRIVLDRAPARASNPPRARRHGHAQPAPPRP